MNKNVFFNFFFCADLSLRRVKLFTILWTLPESFVLFIFKHDVLPPRETKQRHQNTPRHG